MSSRVRPAPRQDAPAFFRRAFLQFLLVLFAVFPARWVLAAPAGAGPDVVIVGEGPVGLSAAIQVKKTNPNAHVVLVEKRGLDRAGRVNTPTLLSGTLNYLDELGIATGPENPSFTYFKTRSRDPAAKLDVPHLINGSAVATAPIGVIEAELRTVALKSGVEVRYDTEIVDTIEHADRVELKLKDGSTINTRFAVLAGGKAGVGSTSESRGGIPMVAGVSKVAGDGQLTVYEVDAQGRRLPPGQTGDTSGEHLTVTRIGARQGTALLLQVPKNMPEGTRTELYNRVVEGSGLPKDSIEKTFAFTSELTVGPTGTTRVFSIGDHGMTVPTLTGAGVNRGFAEARDIGRVLGKIVASGTGASLSTGDQTAIQGFHTSWKNGREAFATHVVETYGSKIVPAEPHAVPKSQPAGKQGPLPSTLHLSATTHAVKSTQPVLTKTIHLESGAPHVTHTPTASRSVITPSTAQTSKPTPSLPIMRTATNEVPPSPHLPPPSPHLPPPSPHIGR